MKGQFLIFTINRLLYTVAGELIFTFGVLNLYVISGGSLVDTILPFIIVHIGHATLVPLTANITGKMGTKYSLIFGSVMILLANIPLMFVTKERFWLVWLWATLFIIGRPFHWTAVHYYVSILTSGKHRGSELGIFRALGLVVIIITPLIGGFVSAGFGILGLISIVVVAIFLSLIPLLKLKNYHFSYGGRFGKITTLRNPRNLIRLALLDQPSAQMQKFWIIYAFIIIGSSFVIFGNLFTVIAIAGIILSLFTGRYLDHHNRRKLLRLDAVIISVSWVLRAFAQTVSGIFFADVFFRFNANIKDTAAGTLTYDYMFEKHTEQIDENIIVRETIINYAAAVVNILFLGIILLAGFNAAFLVTALMTLFFLFA